jgi:hypothetical protein
MIICTVAETRPGFGVEQLVHHALAVTFAEGGKRGAAELTKASAKSLHGETATAIGCAAGLRVFYPSLR